MSAIDEASDKAVRELFEWLTDELSIGAIRGLLGTMPMALIRKFCEPYVSKRTGKSYPQKGSAGRLARAIIAEANDMDRVIDLPHQTEDRVDVLEHALGHIATCPDVGCTKCKIIAKAALGES